MEIMTTLERQIQRNRRLLENDPGNLDLMLTYAQDCLRRDLRYEALITFQKVLEHKDSPEARLSLARIYYLQSLYDESYVEIRNLLKIDPVNIEGHAILHILKDKEEVPEDLAPHLSFVPSRGDLNDAVIRTQNERDLYRREVQEYELVIAKNEDPSPILLYNAREAQKRVDRTNDFLEVLGRWENSAIDLPDVHSVAESEDGKESKSSKRKRRKDKHAKNQQDKDHKVAPAAEVVEPVIQTASELVVENIEQPVEIIEQPSVDVVEAVVEPVSEGTATELVSEPVGEIVEQSVIDTAQVLGTTEIEFEPIDEETLLREELFAEPLDNLCRVKGNVRAMIISADYRLATMSGDFEDTIEIVTSISDWLKIARENGGKELFSWTCEGKNGVLIFQEIKDGYVLVVEGRSITLGVLRQRVERCRGELLAI